MAVYVDALFVMRSREPQAFRVGAKHGHRWSHLFADTEAELLEFAVQGLKMRAAWLQKTPVPHFDLVPPRREKAVKLGAIELERKDLLKLLRKLRSVE